MKKRRLLVFAFSALLLQAGCALYTKPKVATPRTPAKFKETISVAIKDQKIRQDWWKNFNDPELNNLVNLALKNNLDYKIALKNIQAAETYVSEKASDLLPQVNLNFLTTRELDSANTFTLLQALGVKREYSYNNLNTSISYEVDLWRKVVNSVKQAEADVKVSEADTNTLRLVLISNIVDTYFQIRTLNANLINLEKQYKINTEISKLTGNQFTSGLVDVEPVANAKIQIETIKSEIASQEKARQLLLNMLAYLVGEYPETFTIKIKNNAPQANIDFKAMIPPELPANMLAARPDIQSAYYQAISFGYIQKQNLANFFPAISLTDMRGYASSKFANLFSGNSYNWLYGLSATEIVFDYAKRTSQYRRSKIQFEAAILNFQNAIINAFKEVNSSLASYKKDSEALSAYKKELLSAQDKVKRGQAQYASGYADYSSYLNYELSRLEIEYNLTSQALAVYEDIVQTYQALGVGLNSTTSAT